MKEIATASVAALIMAIGAIGGPSHAQERAGASAAVRGDVQLARTNVVGRQVESGETIFLQDSISSGTESGMQILLLDESTFTIGPESEIVIDEFVYDPGSDSGTLSVDLLKGAVRVVTGGIASGDPDDVAINLPTGTIGIRGTRVIAQVLSEEEARTLFPDQVGRLQQGGGQDNGPGVYGFALLTGPGERTRAGSPGSASVTTDRGSVDLSRRGASALFVPGQAPIFFLSDITVLGQLFNLMGSEPSDEDQASQNEAQATAGVPAPQGGGVDAAIQVSGVSSDNTMDALDSVTDAQITEATEVAENTNDFSDFSTTTFDFTTIGDIVSAFSGFGSATATGSFITGAITGDFSSFISFNSRIFDVQFSNLNGGGLSGSSIGVQGFSTPLGSDSAPAIFVVSNVIDGAIPAQTVNCNNCTGIVVFGSPTDAIFEVEHNGEVGAGIATYTGGS